MLGYVNPTWYYQLVENFRVHLQAKKIKIDFRGHLGSLLPRFKQNWIFLEKKRLWQFLYIPIIYHRARNQKKLMSHFWGKRHTYGQTDRQAGRQIDTQKDRLTDRQKNTHTQADNGDLIGPSVWQGGPKKGSVSAVSNEYKKQVVKVIRSVWT